MQGFSTITRLVNCPQGRQVLTDYANIFDNLAKGVIDYE